MKTIAEGIENQQVFDLLRGCGVDYFQGYYFARPRPASELPKHKEISLVHGIKRIITGVNRSVMTIFA